jgi:hypothetical protein
LLRFAEGDIANSGRRKQRDPVPHNKLIVVVKVFGNAEHILEEISYCGSPDETELGGER